jgi:hypothetical protein
MISERAEHGLRFWLRYAESRGALVEDRGDGALVVLPDELQRALGLPEAVEVTSDPEAGRDEDRVVSLLPGHPVLERAAAAVLDQGDAGCAHVPWPEHPPPAPATLLERARESFTVDHGRIDPAGPPAAVYTPVLRVGALVTYTALDQRFREHEEVWVDGRTGLPLPDGDRDRLAAEQHRPGLPGDHRALVPDLALALGEAGRLLEARAAGRGQALAREWLRDVHQPLETARELRPFRLHLLLVPALALPVQVRRGEREYPFAVIWMQPTAGFAGARCPSCRGDEPLVAGRDRLGCRACLTRGAGG